EGGGLVWILAIAQRQGSRSANIEKRRQHSWIFLDLRQPRADGTIVSGSRRERFERQFPQHRRQHRAAVLAHLLQDRLVIGRRRHHRDILKILRRSSYQ